jgi:hypothetical protein
MFIIFAVHHHTMKNVRIKVQTNDGCTTIWYEKSRAKNATDVVCRRVYEQLSGLNLKEVEVTVI